MRFWLALAVVILSSCTAARPVIYTDPTYDPAAVKRLALVIEDHSGLGDLEKNPALASATAANVTSALVAKGYDVVLPGDTTVSYTLLAKIEPVQVSRRYIPHPVRVRKLPVSCEIRAISTGQQLRRAAIDGYRPHSARTAAPWINDPNKLYSIAIQDACEQVLNGVPKSISRGRLRDEQRLSAREK